MGIIKEICFLDSPFNGPILVDSWYKSHPNVQRLILGPPHIGLRVTGSLESKAKAEETL